MLSWKRGEVLVGRCIGWFGNEVLRIETDGNLPPAALMARLDNERPMCHRAEVRGEYTSDGTKHAAGDGRRLASKEPRLLDDDTFYDGWIVE